MFVTTLISMVLTLNGPGDKPPAAATAPAIVTVSPIDLASLPVLRPGDATTGVIAESDPLIVTEVLRSPSYASPVVRGKTYRLELPAGSAYTIELRSYLFDAYLVLRDTAGNVIAEDDDGLNGTHARIVVDARDVNSTYLLNTCALHGGMRDFEIQVVAGKPKTLSPEEQREADLADTSKAVQVAEAVLGPEHPDTATSLGNLAWLLYNQGDYAAARPLYERALRIHETTLGPEHPQTATTLNNLAVLLETQGDLAAARPLYERVARIDETALGPEHPQTASSLNNLAWLLLAQGDLAAARPLAERALRIHETTLGPEHPETAWSLNRLALLLKAQGDLAAARPLLEKALRIHETALGPEHRDTAMSLHNLASVLRGQGDDAAARPLLERALWIHETALGPEHLDTAKSLTTLGRLLLDQGDYAAARPLYERALRIRETALGPEHPQTATFLNNLAMLLKAQGDLAAARPLFEQALRIHETALGPEHRDTAMSLNNLASLLETQGDLAAARPLYERALRICETALGPEHPWTASTCNNLAGLLGNQGDLKAARPLLERALRTIETSLGTEHPLTALFSKNLATVLFDLGELAESLALAQRAVQGNRAQSLRLVWSLTESERLRFAETQRITFRTFLSIAKRGSSANQRAAYETLLQWKAQVLRSLAQSRGQSLAGLSKENQARIDTLGHLQTRLSKELFNKDVENREAHQALLASLRAERQRLELELNRSLGASEDEESVSIDELARALPADSVLVDFLVHPIYIPARLDGDKAIERGHWTEPRLSAWVLPAGDTNDTNDESHAGNLRWIDLGHAAPIEQASKAFLENLVASRGISAVEPEDGPSPADRTNDTLRSLLWDPLREQIGDAERVLVSPDSFLGTLPFEVLRQDDESYLIEHFAFVYLQDAASLATRLRTPTAAESPVDATPDAASLLCIGGVDYRKRGDLAWQEAIEESNNALAKSDSSDRTHKGNKSSESDKNDPNRIDDTLSDSPVIEGLASATPTPSSASSQLLARADVRAGFMNRWSPLPATRDEAIAIADLHEEAFEDGERVVLQKRDATEERIKYELPRHRVLHLATHGFFQPKGLPSMWEQAQKRGGGTEMVMREEEKRLTGLLPGLLSGLVFAGANKAAPTANRDDGLLTAEEISFLDLSNVDLVVLSACESGLGRPQGGEGMLGFRRTFRAAGAKTVISSLWKVSDEATNELMQSFYERLWLDEESKQHALRNAQLDMLKRNRIEHNGDGLPSTWGAFVLDGAWE